MDEIRAEPNRPIPRAVLSGPVRAALMALRAFVIVLAVIVVWTFVAGVLNTR
ncbi:hypothetical protein [Sinomonas atrocyanea]